MPLEKKSKTVSPSQPEQQPRPNLVLGLQRVGAGEVKLSRLDGNTWVTLSEDIFAVIEGKVREQIYNEVFLK